MRISLKTLENIMRYKEFDFTEKDYHRSLVRLTGQGDMRTVRSDLAMLEADNRIKKMRNNTHGTANTNSLITTNIINITQN